MTESLKMSDILYTPIDLPIKESLPNNFLEHWKEFAGVEKRLIPCDNCNPEAPDCCMNDPLWKGLTLYGDFGENPDMGKMFSQPKIPEELAEEYLGLVDVLTTKGPFQSITHLCLWQSLKPIKPHVELNYTYFKKIDASLTFRAIVYDENPQQTFFLCRYDNDDSKPRSQPFKAIKEEDKFYVKAPEFPFCFSWNNYKTLHGSHFDPSYRKILLCVSGVLNKESATKLVLDSAKKYKDYAWFK